MLEGGSSGDNGLGQKHRQVSCSKRKKVREYLGKKKIGHKIGRGSMQKFFVIASIF